MPNMKVVAPGIEVVRPEHEVLEALDRVNAEMEAKLGVTFDEAQALVTRVENEIENDFFLADNKKKRDALDIDPSIIQVSEIVESEIDEDLSVQIAKEAIVNMGPDGEIYIEAMKNGTCQISITEHEEVYLTKEEATELYYKEQEARNEMLGFIVSVVSAAMGNPVPLIADFGKMIVDELTEVETAEMVSHAIIDYAEAGGDLAEFGKGVAVEAAVSMAANLLDDLRHDVGRIEGGTYTTSKVIVADNEQTYGGSYAVPSERLILKDGEPIWDRVNPLTYVMDSTPI